MACIKHIDFPYHLGDAFSFAKIDYDYNFSKIIKIVNLDNYLICAIDQQFNLHFIKYREPYPHEKPVIPPSFAVKGHNKIQFTLGSQTLKSFLYGRNLTETDCVSFYLDRSSIEEGWPECLYLGDNRLLIKLSVQGPTFRMHYDYRLELEKPEIIDYLQDAVYFRQLDFSRIVYFDCTASKMILTCLDTRRAKVLNFNCPKVISELVVLKKQSVLISLFEDTFEVLELRKNKIIGRVVFMDSLNIKICVDNMFGSEKFVTYYSVAHPTHETKIILKVWSLSKQNDLHSTAEIKLSHGSEKTLMRFITQDHLIALDRNSRFYIYKIFENGIIRIHQFEIPLNPGYLPELHMPKEEEKEDQYHYSHLEMLDQNSFVALRTWEVDLDADKQKLFVFDFAIEQTQSEYIDLSLPFESRNRDISKFSVKTLIEHVSDKVIGLTHWKDKFILFLTQSKRLFYYNLKNGLLQQRFNLVGIDSNRSNFQKMEALDSGDIAFIFKGLLNRYRIIVFCLKKNCVIFDSKQKIADSIDLMECFVIDGKIYVEYIAANPEDDDNDVWCFGEINYREGKLERIVDLEEDEIMTKITISPRNIVIGISGPDVFTNNQDVLFFSIDNKEMLYSLPLERFAIDFPGPRKIINVIFHNGNLAIFLIKNTQTEQPDSMIMIWDIEKVIIVGYYKDSQVSHLLGMCNNNLLFLYETTKAESVGYIDLSELLSMLKQTQSFKQEEWGIELNAAAWESYIPEIEFNGFQNLDLLANVAVFYDKKIYPNSLLFLRRRNYKIECLRFVHRMLEKHYHPYVRKEVLEAIMDQDYSEEDDDEEDGYESDSEESENPTEILTV